MIGQAENTDGAAAAPVSRRRTHWLWHLGSALHWAIADAAVGAGAVFVAFALSPSWRVPGGIAGHVAPGAFAVCFAATMFVSCYAFGLNHYPTLRSPLRICLTMAASVLAAILAALSLFWFVNYEQVGRYIAAITLGVAFAAGSALRLFWLSFVSRTVHRVAVFAPEDSVRQLRDLGATFPFQFQILTTAEVATPAAVECLLEEEALDEVVVKTVEAGAVDALIQLQDRGVAVSTLATFSARHFLKIPCDFVDAEWFFRLDLKDHHPFYQTFKRVFDVVVACVLGVLASPLVLLAAAAIRFEGRGPVIYSQIRIGRHQRNFRIYKLRTMRTDSEQNGPQWAQQSDPRVTRVGAWLRRTRIDELPQLWNILRGDMAFVGPRPERPEFVEQLGQTIPFYRQRHLVKPGLTGWAQICYPYGASEADAREKLAYELYHIYCSSLMLDMQIVLRTIGAAMKGAR